MNTEKNFFDTLTDMLGVSSFFRTEFDNLAKSLNDYKKTLDEVSKLAQGESESYTESSSLKVENKEYTIKYSTNDTFKTDKEYDDFIVEHLRPLSIMAETIFASDKKLIVNVSAAGRQSRTFYWDKTDKSFCELNSIGTDVVAMYTRAADKIISIVDDKVNHDFVPDIKDETIEHNRVCQDERPTAKVQTFADMLKEQLTQCDTDRECEERDGIVSLSDMVATVSLVKDLIEEENYTKEYSNDGKLIGISFAFEDLFDVDVEYIDENTKVPDYTEHANWDKDVDWDFFTDSVCSHYGFTDCEIESVNRGAESFYKVFCYFA